jgi:predicted dehydrogenase
LGKNKFGWGSIEKKGSCTEIDGKVVQGKIPTLQGNYYDFFDEVYDSIANDKEEPVTGQDGLRVMQIIEAAIQSSAQKKAINL